MVWLLLSPAAALGYMNQQPLGASEAALPKYLPNQVQGTLCLEVQRGCIPPEQGQGEKWEQEKREDGNTTVNSKRNEQKGPADEREAGRFD